MNYNWRVGGRRGANMIEPHPQRLESPDGQRYALGRYVKRSLGEGVFDGVEVWTLKQRVNGRAVTVETHRDKAAAEAWVNTGEVTL